MKEGTASETARAVAAYRLRFPRVAYSGGDPEADERLQRDVAGDREAPVSPMTRYLRARTEFFDRVVTDALADGVEQLVALGAGYDGRSLRYAAPSTRWFEVDHPETQADKVARLHRLAIDAAHVTFVAADFTTDEVASRLVAAGYDQQVPALFTCEGVAGYLPAPAVGALLAQIGGIASPRTRLAITIALTVDADSASAPRARLAERVAAVGEPLTSTVDRGDLAPFLDHAGWHVEAARDPAGVDIARSTRTSAFVIARPSA